MYIKLCFGVLAFGETTDTQCHPGTHCFDPVGPMLRKIPQNLIEIWLAPGCAPGQTLSERERHLAFAEQMTLLRTSMNQLVLRVAKGNQVNPGFLRCAAQRFGVLCSCFALFVSPFVSGFQKETWDKRSDFGDVFSMFYCHGSW